MGRRSKATQSQLQNLGEASKSRRMRVDDVTSNENEDSSGDAVIEDIGTGAEHRFIVFEDYETDSDRFKGMEIIIWEWGLWPEKGLNAQCEGFKCVSKKTNCCCHRLLFMQPNFVAQK
jgi:hypothetical protein